MQWLAELCVKRPVFASVLSLIILVVGGVFYKQLGVDQFPKIDFPVIVVMTTLPGSSPEDIETDISDKVEAAVNTISGVDELRSNSSEGFSQVVIQFVIDKNVDVASQEVQQKINTILPELPKGIDPPIVMKFDPDSSPVLYVALSAKDRDVRDVTDIADRVVRRRLESVDGVGQALIIGGRKRQVNVEIDPVKLKALGISPVEVAQAINAQNITLPGGRVDTSRDYYSVRVQGRVADVEELKKIVVRDQNGRSVHLDELGLVEDGVEDVATSALWNGERTVLLAIRKQSGTNTVAVVDSVRARMVDIQKELPPGYQLQVQRDSSAVIRTGIDAVTEHLILGSFFAALVVLMFLGNLRSTIIAALAIPTSIIGTFALMKMQGYTLNTITLLALALAVGIVIDDAIVVLENIFKHVEEKNEPPKKAAVSGTREIGMAVTATTLSLIAVFLPIAFIGGIPGKFLGSFGITMSFSIAVSLFVSFTLTPMLASRWLKEHPPGAAPPMLFKVVEFFYRPLERAYMVLLGWSMRHRWAVVLAAFLTLASTVPLAKIAHTGFLPVDDRAQFEVIVRLPEGRSVPATELVGERVARIVRKLPDVTATLLTVGDDPAKTPNQARIYVKLTDPDKRKLTQNQIKDVVRDQILPTLPPELRVNVADVNEFGGGQATQRIQYLMAGPDLKAMEAAVPRIVERMKALPGSADVDSTLVVGKPELGVFVDRQRAADLGVQVLDVAQALQYLVAGQKVSTYSEHGEQYDVRLRATQEYRTDEDALRLITVPSRKLGLVSLADVVQVKRGSGPTTIQRFQRERQVTFMMNPKQGVDEGALGASVKNIIFEEATKLPKGFSVKPQGTTKMMKETMQSFALGLLASLLFMYLILAAQFESWLHPVTILVSLPLTIPFAIASVIIFDQAIDMYALLGLFVLFGVVKKNAILQIDHTNQLRERQHGVVEKALHAAEAVHGEQALRHSVHEQLDRFIGRDLLEEAFAKVHFGDFEAVKRATWGAYRLKAILRANKDRLRPILMTTFAFVAGMIPLITARGVGSGFNKATAGVVVGGQILSLVLTLLTVPVAYSYFDDFSAFLKRVFGGKGKAAATEHKPHEAAIAAEVSK